MPDELVGNKDDGETAAEAGLSVSDVVCCCSEDVRSDRFVWLAEAEGWCDEVAVNRTGSA